MSPLSTSALPQLPSKSKQKMTEQVFPGTSPEQRQWRRDATAQLVTSDVFTSHPPHSSRAGPSGLGCGVPLLAYDTNQPALPGLPLWQNLTSNDHCGCLFYGLTAEYQGRAAGLLAVLLSANLSSSEGLCLVNKRDLAALSCPQVPLNIPVKGNQNTLKKLNVWFIILKMLFVYRV